MRAASTTELRAAGFAINRRRARVHPKLVAAEASRVRRVRSTRRTVMGNRFLWYPTEAPARELPITLRHRPRWVREYMARLGYTVKLWGGVPKGLL